MGFHRLPNGNVIEDPTNEAMLKRVRNCCIALALLAIILASIFGPVEGARPPQLSGYKAVPIHYGRLNKMIMSVRINWQPANLLVDTGSNQVILDATAAELFGVRPSQRAEGLARPTVEGFGLEGFRYIRLAQINGQELPVGFAQSLTAGSMSFGSVLVALRNSSRQDSGNARVDGVLGLDILGRYKAVINCRTKLVFFKVDQTRQMQLGPVAASEKFTRIPLRREENGALTVPCSIHGQPARLLVDTGAFITTFHEAFVRSLGIPLKATRVSAHFARGAARKVSAGQIDDLRIGDFKAPRAKFGVTALPNFALQQGSTRISGILGIDTLYNYHAIIDFDGMNLFLK
jgi:predicted aspartyl protease